MKKFYIPTSSLNFNNILSSESISPKAFYTARSFGYARWINIPENPFENSIVLYEDLCSFVRPPSDYEDHPLLLEVTLDDYECSNLVALSNHLYLCDRTLYINPFSSSLYFFSENDKRIALSLSDSSLETKFTHLYAKKIIAIAPPSVSYQPIENDADIQPLNSAEIEKDKRTNKMKGLLYGYYIGAILSASKENVKKLNTAREIQNIQAAILASFDHKATSQQRDRLKSLYAAFQPEVPFLAKLSSLVKEKSIFDSIVTLVRVEYGYIKGEFDVDRVISQLLAGQYNSEVKNPVMERTSALIKQIKADIVHQSSPVSDSDSEVVVIDNSLVHMKLQSLSDDDEKLCKAWLNEVLSKDVYSGKVSTFKEALSDDVTKKAKEVHDGEWKGSYQEVTLNALRRHVRGDEFPHVWNNDILSSISALLVRGDDWQKLLEFMQGKEMTDYRIAYAMYGTINGFANLPRDFTDVLFAQNRNYIANIYKEFYGQLFGRSVIITAKQSPLVETPIVSSIEEDIPDIENDGKSNAGLTSKPVSKENDPVQHDKPQALESFDSMMADICEKCKGAKKDEKMYHELFVRYGGINPEFVDAVCDESIFGKKVQQGVKQVLAKYLKCKNGFTQKRMPVGSKKEQTSNLFASAYPSTGIFLKDFDFLVNNFEFESLMSGISKKWIEDLKWFIDAHNPSHKDYHFYEGKQTDNSTTVRQFINLKKGKYSIAELFLRKTYHL